MLKDMRSMCIALLFAANTAHANDLVIAIGWDDLFDSNGDDAVALLVEYHGDPFYSSRYVNLSFMALLQGDTDGDVFTGVGLYNIFDVGRTQRFFVEGGLAFGYYRDDGSQHTDDDGSAWRSSIGFGMHMSETRRISVSIGHLMNTSFKNHNPGSETLNFRYTFSF